MLRELGTSRPCQAEGPILVDGLWDNPHYWLRYTLLRAALGLDQLEEVGLLNTHNARLSRSTFRNLGIDRTMSLVDFYPTYHDIQDEVEGLLGQIHEPGDILGLVFPFGFPGAWVYDGILRRQRKQSVEIRHGRFKNYIVEAVQTIYAADRLLRSCPFKLVALSHALNFSDGALAWRAAQLGIPSIVLYGAYGVSRFVKITSGTHLIEQVCRPSDREMDALDVTRRDQLAAIGYRQLLARRAGHTDDLGSVYAYQRALRPVTRGDIVEHFKWNPSTPIVAIFVPNFFDFPHFFGMTNFLDIGDWLRTTLKTAEDVREVNWLVRAHPCDEWYGGETVGDALPPTSHSHIAHIGFAPADWNGAAIQDAVDAIITYSGTIGVEAAALGKPVLIADRGWYHDCGFAVWPKTREAYLQALKEDWWRSLDLVQMSHQARMFAGWYFGCPDWQDSFVVPDDSRQAMLYQAMPDLLEKNRNAIEREILEIGAWIRSDHRLYHIFKMVRAEQFAIPVITR